MQRHLRYSVASLFGRDTQTVAMKISRAILVVVGLLQGLLAATVPVTKTTGSDAELISSTQLSTVVTSDPLTTSKSTGTITTLNIKQKTTTATSSDPTPAVDTTQSTKRTTLRPTTRSSKWGSEGRQPFEPILPLAEPCDESKCHLPDCRCSDIKLGGTIPTERIPQLVTITFDDAVTGLNYDIFEDLFKDIRNPDGCEASATFYFSHEYTDYTKVHKLWAEGHELALHSITHGMGTAYWKKATVDVLMREFGQQLEMVEHFAQIDRSDIKGMRMPHFEIPGNNSYVVAQKLGLLYDSSWPTQRFTEPALWPYTLDYKSMQDCPIGVCPDASFPGLWINPLVNWEDIEGYKCAMLDACIHLPEDDPEQILEWMISNFNRHYLGNRAPFGAYLHSSWFQKGENYLEAFKEFIRYMNRHTDVYFVSASRVIEYVQKPVAGKPFKGCPTKREPSCKATLCQLRKVDTKDERWLNVCSPCPDVYPWLDNPLGVSRPSL